MTAQKREYLTVHDKARLLQDARGHLENYRETLVKLWGDNYTDNPLYEQAVQELAFNSRTPSNVLSDYLTGA